jgi:hypothetical protein
MRYTPAVLLVLYATAAFAQVLVPVKKYSATCGDGVDAVVLANNKGRTLLGVINDSDATMYLAFGEAAVSGKGVRLNASGGAVLYDAKIPAGAVHCITSGAAKNVTIHEGSK